MRTKTRGLTTAYPLVLTLFTLASSACGVADPRNSGGTGDEIATQQAALSTARHYYLRCNATGWGVDAHTRLVGDTTRSLEFDVTLPWMVSDGDSCILTSTNQLDGWGTSTVEYGITSSPLRVPEEQGAVLWGGHFRVRFPSLGRYRAELDLANDTLRVTPAAEAEPQRGLCVIADFADRTLEDYSGPGFRNVGDVAATLDEMEAHWEWLSRGREDMEWDVMRVTLPVPFSPTAYPSWWDYREAVVTLALAQIDLADYDQDQDGDLDAMWIIGSDGQQESEFLIGGASFNANAHVFVDGQGSYSIEVGAIGNFNHELGHLRGLPDLYGDFTTVDNMTVMAYSWPLPPHDFTAYERIALGWLEPTVVAQSTGGIVLPPAHDQMQAVLVPTAHEMEYFLIEYRRTPADGYGSQSPAYDGLAVYHVLAVSHQGQNPPLLKVEPADGQITPPTTADPEDLLYPENPALTLPFVARTYFGGGEVLRITSLARVSGGIRFDVVVSDPSSSSSNLAVNGSFELGAGDTPDSWWSSAWQDQPGTFAWETGVAFQGSRSVSIANATLNDARWEQALSNLTPGQAYAACARIKGEAIEGAQVGGNVSVMWTDPNGDLAWVQSPSQLGSFDWQEECTVFQAASSEATLQCRLGHFGNTVTGQLWCDSLTVEPIGSAF